LRAVSRIRRPAAIGARGRGTGGKRSSPRDLPSRGACYRAKQSGARREQALVSVVQQAYVCGVSTRRVDQLVESLGLRISKSEVSRIAGLLDEQVQAFP